MTYPTLLDQILGGGYDLPALLVAIPGGTVERSNPAAHKLSGALRPGRLVALAFDEDSQEKLRQALGAADPAVWELQVAVDGGPEPLPFLVFPAERGRAALIAVGSRGQNHISESLAASHSRLVDLTRELAQQHRETEVARAAAAAGEAHQRAILDQLPIGVVLAEAHSASLTYANQQAAEIIRSPALFSRPLREFVPIWKARRLDGTTLALGDWPIVRALEQGEVVAPIDIAVAGEDGASRIVRVSAAPLRDRDGEVVAAMATLADVTDERHVEAERAQLLRSMELVIGILGHDLRNPLSATSLVAATLLRDQSLPESVRVGGERIARNVERMARLIDQLLDFTRVGMGQGMRVHRASCDLAVLGRHIMEEVESAHPGTVLRLDARGNASGEWDEIRLGQVLTNLLTNALAYGDSGAPVTLTVEDVGDEVAIHVHNFGPPIARDLLPRIFEPFRGVEPTRGRRSLGLGLFIVRQIVEAHGGTVKVHSAPETGTIFTVRLPRCA